MQSETCGPCGLWRFPHCSLRGDAERRSQRSEVLQRLRAFDMPMTELCSPAGSDANLELLRSTRVGWFGPWDG